MLEDEFHVICACPEHDKARTDLLTHTSPQHTLNSTVDVCRLLSTGDADKLRAVGSFLVRLRQTRRRLKNSFEQLNEKFNTQSFASKRAAWRLNGKPACRHGVLFTHLPANGCKCMSTDSAEADWQHARYMPALNADLKCIATARFHLPTFRRLGLLQAQARALHW